MFKAPVPVNETQRLSSLRALQLLDTRPDERFDRITRMAQRMFAVETSLIGLLDADRLWLKSAQGFDAAEMPRDIALCSHTILGEDVFVVGDALADPRFEDNPLVAADPGLRFYAGCPIRSPEGLRIGSLSILDSQPRGFPEADRALLRDLAAMVEDECRAPAQAGLDPLTGVASRAGFATVAGHMLSLCRRTNTPAELLAFRIEGFGDRVAGTDAALQESGFCAFADLLRASFRAADVVARIGPEEFVVLLTAGDGSAAPAVRRLDELARVDSESSSLAADQSSTRLADMQWRAASTRFDPLRHMSVDSLLVDVRLRLDESRVDKLSVQA